MSSFSTSLWPSPSAAMPASADFQFSFREPLTETGPACIAQRVEGAEPIQMKPGQAFVEPQNRPMQAFNTGDAPAKLLVVTMAAEGQPTAEALIE